MGHDKLHASSHEVGGDDEIDLSGLSGDLYNVMAYGAVGDGSTDDTSAIQSAINAATSAGAKVFAPGKTFKITSKITIKCDADFSLATFDVYSTPSIAVEISTGSASNPTDQLRHVTIWLPKLIDNKTKPASGWASQGTGVRVVNLAESIVYVGNILQFDTGLLLTSYTNGNVYNTFTFGHLENNKKNLVLKPGDADAWVNQNTFIGGRFNHYSNEGTNVSGTRAIQFAPFDVTNSDASWPNNNTFLNSSVEGSVSEYDVEVSGSHNLFITPRFEATPKVLLTGHASVVKTSSNIFFGGVDTDAITFTTSGLESYNGIWTPRGSNLDVNDRGFSMSVASSSNNPLIQGFQAGTSSLGKTSASTDWTVSLAAHNLRGKAEADSDDRVKIQFTNGNTYTLGTLGVGTTAPDKAVEINHATGGCLRLTYNDANGSAANKVDFDVSSSGDITVAPSGGDFDVTGNIDASGEVQSVGTRINYNLNVLATGTAYVLTNTAAAINVGTTDPAITLDKAGTYLIMGQVHLAYNAATVVAETATIKVRRTNNTAADLSPVVVLDLPVATTLTHSYGIFQIPPFFYTTAATDDAVTLFANVSATLGAGSIDVTAIGTSLSAVRMY